MMTNKRIAICCSHSVDSFHEKISSLMALAENEIVIFSPDEEGNYLNLSGGKLDEIESLEQEHLESLREGIKRQSYLSQSPRLTEIVPDYLPYNIINDDLRFSTGTGRVRMEAVDSFRKQRNKTKAGRKANKQRRKKK